MSGKEEAAKITCDLWVGVFPEKIGGYETNGERFYVRFRQKLSFLNIN